MRTGAVMHADPTAPSVNSPRSAGVPRFRPVYVAAVIDTDALPSSPAEVTPQWLTVAASARFPDARAQKVTIVDAHSGTTGRARIRVDWKGTQTPAESLFLKLLPTDETSRLMVLTTGMGRREARFYEHVAEHVPVRVPRPLFAGTNEDGSSYLMVLEDLEAAGCSFPTNDERDLLHNARSMMRSLGRLHATYAQTNGHRPELEFVEGPMKSEWGKLLVEAGLEQFGAEMPAEFSQLARLYLDANEEFNALFEDGEKTLLHGDTHPGNLFIDGGEVGYLDWACTCRSVGMRDVAYFSCTSLPTALRRDHEGELLGIYSNSLDDNGAPRDIEELRDHYRRYAAYGWVAAVTTLAAGDRMQSIEIGRRATERANATIRDLGTVEYFRERL